MKKKKVDIKKKTLKNKNKSMEKKKHGVLTDVKFIVWAHGIRVYSSRYALYFLLP